ncbi:MmpS family transport accessory protein [Mycobacterium sp. pUA109]|uniref:MmpS family transport accessory protein n=1 Tax=Mycobacterium sp. pUA109 TaxID=3238982 RepID=UPI00351B2FFF
MHQPFNWSLREIDHQLVGKAAADSKWKCEVKRSTVASKVTAVWIPCAALLAGALGVVGVYNLHGIFGSNYRNTNAPTDQIVSVNKKDVIYELFGPERSSGMISYLDEHAQPHKSSFTSLPWSLTITTTATSVIADIFAQGDAQPLGCRITINGVVRDEQSSDGVDAATFCLVKSA